MNLNTQQRAPRGVEHFATLQQAFEAAAILCDALPIALCLCDADGRVVRLNRRAAELWGGAPGTLLRDARKIYDTDGRLIPDEEAPIFQALRTGKPCRDRTLIVESGDGSRLTVLTSVSPVLSAGDAAVGAIVCFQDIGELKRTLTPFAEGKQDVAQALQETDKRLAATYENAGIGIAEVDADGKFVRINEALCAISGFSRAELMNRRLFAQTHPEDAARDRINFRQQVTGGYDRYSIEKRLVRKDGREIWLLVTSTSVRDKDEKFLYGVRVVQDITEQKQAEARHKALLEELNHRVKNTLATVQTLAAHTLRDAGVAEGVRLTFDARLAALGRAHEHLARERWESADLAFIAREMLRPFQSGTNAVRIDGAVNKVQPQAAVTIGFVLHELALNAAKYGSLSVPRGAVDLSWSVSSERKPTLRIDWRETGGPEVKPPVRQGFGSRLLDWGIVQELKGDVAARYEPAGFSCRLEIPLSSVTA